MEWRAILVMTLFCSIGLDFGIDENLLNFGKKTKMDASKLLLASRIINVMI